ncbi:MAG TPA: hypothetical protein VHM25_05165 [Polyangiaceae bacterium]|jgi:hypothetical protein|nr:hypothetical protein [Polyangiaceae bacterium]
MLQFSDVKSAFVCLGLSLSLCVACGGSDDSKGSTAGDAGTGNPGAGSGNPGAGSGNPGAGSGNSGGGSGGGSSGGSGPSAGGAPTTTSGTFSSGLAGDKQLGSLTDDEAASLCQKLSEYFADGSAVSRNFEEVTCRVSSVLFSAFGGAETDAALQASCKTFYDSCVAAPTMSSESCKKPDASCTATTGEYEACVNDSVKQISQLGSAVPTCDQLTIASAGALFTGGSASASPASCQAVSAKCPDAPSSGAFDPSGSFASDP